MLLIEGKTFWNIYLKIISKHIHGNTLICEIIQATLHEIIIRYFISILHTCQKVYSGAWNRNWERLLQIFPQFMDTAQNFVTKLLISSHLYMKLQISMNDNPRHFREATKYYPRWIEQAKCTFSHSVDWCGWLAFFHTHVCISKWTTISFNCSPLTFLHRHNLSENKSIFAFFALANSHRHARKCSSPPGRWLIDQLDEENFGESEDVCSQMWILPSIIHI